MMNNEWLNRKETCERLFISLRTLQYWKSEGLLKPVRISRKGERVFYNKKEVDSFYEFLTKNKNLQKAHNRISLIEIK